MVHASRGSSTQLADASGKFSEDFDEFLDAGIEMAGHTQVQSEWSVCLCGTKPGTCSLGHTIAMETKMNISYCQVHIVPPRSTQFCFVPNEHKRGTILDLTVLV